MLELQHIAWALDGGKEILRDISIQVPEGKLVVATGPGANSRQALGTAVVGGMFMAVVIGTFLIPAFYVIVQQAIELVKRKAEK